MPPNVLNKLDVQPVKLFKGIFRRTLIYNPTLMLCHFTLEKSAEVPIHSHKEHQIGYVLKGKLKFITENDEFICSEGDSYIFGSNEKHGAIMLEDSEVIDIFHPAREDYK